MPLIIQYLGVFDLDKIIDIIKKWIKKYDFDVDKKKFVKKEKIPQEFELKIECSRSVTAYCKYKVSIEVKIRNMFDVTLKTKDGEKELKKGYVEITIDHSVDISYEKYFEDNFILKAFYNIVKDWFKNLFYGEKKQLSDRLDEIVSELRGTLKSYLENGNY